MLFAAAKLGVDKEISVRLEAVAGALCVLCMLFKLPKNGENTSVYG